MTPEGFEGLNPPYRTIVADPPWPYDEGFVRGPSGDTDWSNRHPLPYSPLTFDEICALPIGQLAHDDGAFLFLWTTNRYLPSAFKVLDAWGFTYRQTLVWHKGDASPFPAAVAPNSAEYLLVSKAGNATRKGTAPTSVLYANRRHHSAKPAAFCDLIERVSSGPYVELFARQPRLGWDSWGWGYEEATG